MAARDRFTYNLKCPECGATGVANASQEDGWSYLNGDQSTSIDSVPDGFIDKSTGARKDIHCAACECSVEMK